MKVNMSSFAAKNDIQDNSVKQQPSLLNQNSKIDSFSPNRNSQPAFKANLNLADNVIITIEEKLKKNYSFIVDIKNIFKKLTEKTDNQFTAPYLNDLNVKELAIDIENNKIKLLNANVDDRLKVTSEQIKDLQLPADKSEIAAWFKEVHTKAKEQSRPIENEYYPAKFDEPWQEQFSDT